MYRTDRVELLEIGDDHPVLGSDPQVEYRAPGLSYNGDVQNPKALNADLPADVDRSTGVDGSNVFTRDPQVGLFRVWRDGIGTSVFTDLYLINNHFSSGPDGRVGQRTEQAAYNAAIVEALQAANPHVRVVLGGDLNVFPRPDDPFRPGDALFPSDQLAPLYDGGLFNLYDVLVQEVPASAYTYTFQGQAQVLDHQFVNDPQKQDLTRVRVAHINADWPADYDGYAGRGASDHDPVRSRYLNLPTVERLIDLVTYFEQNGEIRSNEANRLHDTLERAKAERDRGNNRAYRAQLTAFIANLRGPHIGDTAKTTLRQEAQLLLSSVPNTRP
jgi:hypothetical protein